MPAYLTPHPEGVVIEVWVVPGASRDQVAGLRDGALRVRTVAPPEGGRANRAVVALLVERLGGSSGDLLSGPGSRRKRILVRGVTVPEVERALPTG